MSPLIGLSVALLALKLGGVSDVSYILIVLPAALHGLYMATILYRQKRELDLIIKAIEKARGNINDKDENT